MITLTILGTGMMAMLVLQTQALADGSRGKHTSGAAMVAKDQLEQIQRMPFSGADLQPATWKTPAWLANAGDPVLGAGDIGMHVTQPGGAVIEKIYKVWYRRSGRSRRQHPDALVDLEVVWDEGKITNNRPTRTGKPTVALSTVIANNDR